MLEEEPMLEKEEISEAEPMLKAEEILAAEEMPESEAMPEAESAAKAESMPPMETEAATDSARALAPTESGDAHGESAPTAGTGLAHYLLDMAAFAMMGLPLVVAGGGVYVLLRRLRRGRAEKNKHK